MDGEIPKIFAASMVLIRSPMMVPQWISTGPKRAKRGDAEGDDCCPLGGVGQVYQKPIAISI